jgi:pimeloyl-ACP methyl ester carboxylesterase
MVRPLWKSMRPTWPGFSTKTRCVGVFSLEFLLGVIYFLNSGADVASVSPEARSARLQSAADVLEHGTEPFFESMVPKLLGTTTRDTRPDLVQGALTMMRKMLPENVAQVQRGMAERPDSVTTLKTINVPTLVLTGSEDILTGSNEAAVMHENIPGSQLILVARAGHFAAWEQPDETGTILRRFLESLPPGSFPL